MAQDLIFIVVYEIKINYPKNVKLRVNAKMLQRISGDFGRQPGPVVSVYLRYYHSKWCSIRKITNRKTIKLTKPKLEIWPISVVYTISMFKLHIVRTALSYK